MTNRLALAAVVSRVYAAALWICPRDVRIPYAGDMRLTFDASVREASHQGRGRVLRLLARELVDLARTAVAGRRSEPVPGIPRAPVLRPFHVPERRRPVSGILQDVRYAARMLRRQPAFALVAVATLALGIGANTAVFTVINGVLLRPLPYRDPDRLVVMLFGQPGRRGPSLSPLNYLDFTTRSQAFGDSTAAFTTTRANITDVGEPEQLDGAMVSWNFFDVLGASVAHGRAFAADDVRTPEPSTVIISERVWQRRYGGRADAIGLVIHMDGKPVTIVGVAAPDIAFPRSVDFWQPLVFTPRDIAPPARGAQWVSAIARLKPGMDLAGANTALAAVSTQLAAEFPRINAGRVAVVVPLHDRIVGTIRPALVMLLSAVSLVLLIACANVANLLMARAYGRTREFGVRAALGASRRRLVQQCMAESLLLGGLGAAAGLLVAEWATRTLIWFGPRSIPRLADVWIDLRVLAFTAAIAAGTALLFGLAPMWLIARDAATGLNGRGATGHHSYVRRSLVVCELTLAVVLLIGAGLLIRSYEHVQQVNPGFDPDGVMTFSVSLPDAGYPDADRAGAFITTLVSRIGARPGVTSAAAVYGLPFAGQFSASTSFTRAGETDSADAPNAGMRIVTPDYFKTLRIPLQSGRLFDEHDDGRGAEVVIVNHRAAVRFWPGQDPIGRQIHVGVTLSRSARSGEKTIVGVVGDVKYGALDADTPAEIYLPYLQHQVSAVTIAVRTAADPASIAPLLRQDVGALDRELPIANLRPMTSLIGTSVAERRFIMMLLTTFATVAVALAAIGIYGVLAYLVGQRTREIGVRLAIGATPPEIAWMFIREGAMLAAAGLVCGIAGALSATRMLSASLFGVTAADPLTFGLVAAGLAAVALLAAFVPARRAARVDPTNALRDDRG